MAVENIDHEQRFAAALNVLSGANVYSKSLYKADFLQKAAWLFEEKGGVEILYRYAPQFEPAGVFSGGAWEDAAALQPNLVEGTIKTEGPGSIIECLSELRMLAIAEGACQHPRVSAVEAAAFLEKVLALNVEMLFPPQTETARIGQTDAVVRAQLLFSFLGKHVRNEGVFERVKEELDRLAVQRPIDVSRIEEMIRFFDRARTAACQVVSEGDKYIFALQPTALSQRKSVKEYEQQLEQLHETELVLEAEQFARSMKKTGIVSPYHAVFIRKFNRVQPVIVKKAFGLSDRGAAFLQSKSEVVAEWIEKAVFPGTKQAVYGFASFLENKELTGEMEGHLRELMKQELCPEVHHRLERMCKTNGDCGPKAYLLAGCASVLGQPLGVAQGMNPSCQSTRAISLWAQHKPEFLMKITAGAAIFGRLEMEFEGEPLISTQAGTQVKLDGTIPLDAVSVVLLPLLHDLYQQMLKRCLFKTGDVHRWVNPAFYGDWVLKGFCSRTYGNLVDSAFTERFIRNYHPGQNPSIKAALPQPAGVFITDRNGKLLGYHAISIQRVGKGPDGTDRVYFYNPNNDSGQVWGRNAVCSIKGSGELEGEASLPIEEFLSSLYAFHFDG
ncbi:hypothetical protein [Bacillus marinisedimentorum]|uniref:hypothetical protein n=1 Tax=Bacillus marinisedimentorum TaxID=1821260 RepID=UPI0007E12233|nr:hypothetical protein [Bacillus marinisedimentorum]